MSGNRHLTNRGEEEEVESDEECNNNLTVSINKKSFELETLKVKKAITKKRNVKLASVNADLSSAIEMIDTYDRPGKAYTEGTYAGAGKYASAFENKPGKRIPKAGVYAAAGVGLARAEYRVFEVEAKGPNAAAGAEASVVGVGAMARAELASASGKAGPVGLKLGLGADTGASVGLGGIEAKFLGTGFSIGTKTSVSILGSEASLSCAVM